MQSVKYRLKKPLPDSKIGDAYIRDGSSNAYFKNGDVNESYWLEQFVENNPEWFEPIPSPPTTIDTKSKEWEILEFKNTVGQTLRLYENEHYRWDYSHGNSNGWLLKDILANNFIIHSVKRLSDGEVFSVGDSVCLNWYPPFTVKQPIERFEIVGDKMMLRYASGSYDLKYAMINPHHSKQPSPKEKSKPQDTFTWTDGRVKEFVKYYNDLDGFVFGADPIGETIQSWKQSKAPIPKEEKKERVRCVHIWKDEKSFLHFGGDTKYVVETLGEIPEEKFSLIKQSIEKVLNGEWGEWTIHPMPNTYTKEQMDKAIADAFNAGRERDIERPLLTTYPPNSAIKELTLYADKFSSISDYLQTIKSNRQ